MKKLILTTCLILGITAAQAQQRNEIPETAQYITITEYNELGLKSLVLEWGQKRTIGKQKRLKSKATGKAYKFAIEALNDFADEWEVLSVYVDMAKNRTNFLLKRI